MKPKTKDEKYIDLLNSFCSQDAVGGDLAHIGQQGDYYFASDGITMLAVPLSEADIPDAEQPKADFLHVMPTSKTEELRIAIAATRIAIEKVLPLKDHMTQIEETCIECGGEGEVKCDMEYMHPCIKCGGEGSIEKEVPTGSKVTDLEQAIELGGVMYRVIPLFKILDAVRKMGEREVIRIHSGPTSPSLFHAGKCKFLLMPCVPDKIVTPLKVDLP